MNNRGEPRHQRATDCGRKMHEATKAGRTFLKGRDVLRCLNTIARRNREATKCGLPGRFPGSRELDHLSQGSRPCRRGLCPKWADRRYRDRIRWKSPPVARYGIRHAEKPPLAVRALRMRRTYRLGVLPPRPGWPRIGLAHDGPHRSPQGRGKNRAREKQPTGRWSQARPSRDGPEDVVVGKQLLGLRQGNGLAAQFVEALHRQITAQGVAGQITDRAVLVARKSFELPAPAKNQAPQVYLRPRLRGAGCM